MQPCIHAALETRSLRPIEQVRSKENQEPYMKPCLQPQTLRWIGGMAIHCETNISDIPSPELVLKGGCLGYFALENFELVQF